MTTRSHTVLITILALAGFALLGIGRQEIQPWDEALVASRAQSIILFDAWVDQASHTTGGLAAAARPPMEAWVVVPSLSTMGPSSLAIRLPGIVLLALSLAAIYQLGKRVLSFEGAMLAVCLAAASPAVFGSARSATSAMPSAVGLLWFLVAVVAVHRGESRIRWALVGGVAAGVALLSSSLLAVAIIVVTTVWSLVGASARHRSSPVLLGMVVMGFGLAIPWYVAMSNIHGKPFFLAATAQHNPYGRTFFDLPGLLLLGTAGLPVLASYVVGMLRNRRLIVEPSATAVILSLAAALVAMILGAAMPSMQADVVPLVAAMLSVTIVYVLERMRRSVGRRHLVLTYAVMLVGCVFLLLGLVAPWLDPTVPSIWGYVAIAIPVIIMLVPAVLPSPVVDRIAVLGWKPVVYGTVVVGLLTGVGQGWFGGAATNRGARDVGARLLEAEVPSFVLLYHDVPQASANDPALSWYTGGWMNGWRPGRTYGAVRIPTMIGDERGYSLVQAIGMQGKSVYIVHAHGGVSSEAYAYVRDALAGAYDAVPLPGRADYTLYRRILR